MAPAFWRAPCDASFAMTKTKATIDHDEIREWAEQRDAHPACVRGTGGRGDVGMIRLDFPGYSGAQSLREISWEQFFRKFDEGNLALVYQDTLARGGRSNFNKLVGRETVDVGGRSGRKTAPARRRTKPASSRARTARPSRTARTTRTTRAKKPATKRRTSTRGRTAAR